MFKKAAAILMILCMVILTVTGCGESGGDKTTEETTAEVKAVTNLPKLDMTKWQYSEDHDIYYQTGVDYCETPADEKYEKLAVFVPGAIPGETADIACEFCDARYAFTSDDLRALLAENEKNRK